MTVAVSLGVQFSRTVAPETSKGPALIAFIKQNNWTKAVMLTSTSSISQESGNGLTRQLQEAGIDVLKQAPFEPGGFRIATLLEIKCSGIRIVILIAFDNDTHTVASGASHERMDSTYAWIVPEERTACLQIQGWLYLRPLLPSHSMQAFAEQVRNYTKSSFNLTVSTVDLTYSVALYDAGLL